MNRRLATFAKLEVCITGHVVSAEPELDYAVDCPHCKKETIDGNYCQHCGMQLQPRNIYGEARVFGPHPPPRRR